MNAVGSERDLEIIARWDSYETMDGCRGGIIIIGRWVDDDDPVWWSLMLVLCVVVAGDIVTQGSSFLAPVVTPSFLAGSPRPLPCSRMDPSLSLQIFPLHLLTPPPHQNGSFHTYTTTNPPPSVPPQPTDIHKATHPPDHRVNRKMQS